MSAARSQLATVLDSMAEALVIFDARGNVRTVNGAALPATYYQDDVEKDQFFAGTIALAADHSWTGSLSVDATAIPSGPLSGLATAALISPFEFHENLIVQYFEKARFEWRADRPEEHPASPDRRDPWPALRAIGS